MHPRLPYIAPRKRNQSPRFQIHIERLHSKPSLVFIQHTLSSLSLFTVIPSKKERNLSALPTCQSFRGLEKEGLQPPFPRIGKSQASSTHASLEHAKENKDEKDSHNGSIPHHLSFQNLTLCPLPTSKDILLLTSPHSFLTAFQTPTPCPSVTSLEHYPPSSSPYFPLITRFQRASFSIA